jgi:hypothetical protein
MEIRFIAYLTAGTLFTLIHDVFNMPDAFYAWAIFCYWRMLVEAGRIIRAERESRDR